MPLSSPNLIANWRSPSLGAVLVAPSDLQDQARLLRAVTLPLGGRLRYRSSFGETIHQTQELPPGTYAIRTRRIYAQGTTALAITGWF